MNYDDLLLEHGLERDLDHQGVTLIHLDPLGLYDFAYSYYYETIVFIFEEKAFILDEEIDQHRFFDYLKDDLDTLRHKCNLLKKKAFIHEKLYVKTLGMTNLPERLIQVVSDRIDNRNRYRECFLYMSYPEIVNTNKNR